MKRGCLISAVLLAALIVLYVYTTWPRYWSNSHSALQLSAVSQMRELYQACLDYEDAHGVAPSGWEDFDSAWASRLQQRFLHPSDSTEMIVHWDAFADRERSPHEVFVANPGVTSRYGARAKRMAWMDSMSLLACGQSVVVYGHSSSDQYPLWWDEMRFPHVWLELELLDGQSASVVARGVLELPGLQPAPWTLEGVDQSAHIFGNEGVAHWTLTGSGTDQERVVRCHPEMVDHNLFLTISGDSGSWEFFTDAGLEAQGVLRVVEKSSTTPPNLRSLR